MRTDPIIISEEEKLDAKEKSEKITRMIALVFAFISVFIFFFKLLFF